MPLRLPAFHYPAKTGPIVMPGDETPIRRAIERFVARLPPDPFHGRHRAVRAYLYWLTEDGERLEATFGGIRPGNCGGKFRRYVRRGKAVVALWADQAPWAAEEIQRIIAGSARTNRA